MKDSFETAECNEFLTEASMADENRNAKMCPPEDFFEECSNTIAQALDNSFPHCNFGLSRDECEQWSTMTGDFISDIIHKHATKETQFVFFCLYNGDSVMERALKVS